MTKIEELAKIDAELALLEHELAREKEVWEASNARIAVINTKLAQVLNRLEAVRISHWQ